MITLPGVNPGVKANVGQDKTDATADVIDTGGAVQQKASGGFVALLSGKLLSLAKPVNTANAAPLNPLDSTGARQSAKEKLNALLAAQEQDSSGMALPLIATHASVLQTKDDTQPGSDKQAVLNSNDTQALQALFAMLQPTATQPVAQTVSGNNDGTLKETTALAVAVAGKTSGSDGGNVAVDVDAHDAPTVTSSNNTGNVQTGAMASAAMQTHAAVDAAAVPANGVFQQVLNSMAKEPDKDQAAPTASTSTNVNTLLGAATPAPMPATSSPFVTAAATPSLASPLGSQEWQQALGHQIMMFSRNGQQSAELHLHPQDLGSIQISLKLDNDMAQLNMVSGHSQVRAALEAALPQLRTALAESGISLGQSNVSSDAFTQNQSFAQQQQQQRNSGSGTFSLTAENESEATPLAVPASLQARASGNGGVDIFA